ncbi:MAG: hypothetical protein J07HR59_01562 [Halorubrum sp. J07HR59]|nr:MAG: hypothetical protein J07HR59_01562 [Halorubrum sp. J07HR59]
MTLDKRQANVSDQVETDGFSIDYRRARVGKTVTVGVSRNATKQAKASRR